ncbi:NAD(P)-dependent dehydrogenase (short-subunit alcohol dehydrogenase family) [Enterococcus sp. PF1-24]|uniref:SDR family NAD(P)-dependent oxidoreductase n=1 Tax=unclassified Enterococcus TaxID=2608891 RepID=UPI002474A317|nr:MULTISPECIES: SDR family NAD(P)-dependent oxidoreductase [unclassified Enterococcus]MDH6364839.1 NAD(P)-dependent dehydrogenase (short-subunit alcohol dehydrogenase family) [Enterococcus sp. PFB1-1]MDH6401937.1 NAD(P)-dependent dehydrogenase (short-subunit alcohol dehydrogenase family) [Enterococcus sp. PF1-24]
MMAKKTIALIAGGTSGVGKRTAIDLAERDFEIILIGRNKKKGEEIKRELQEKTQNSAIAFYAADLSTKAGVATRLKADLNQIDVLVSTVGVMLPELHLTADGYDQNFVLNYLTHFWLINQLLPLLKKSAQGRILLVGAMPFAINHAKVKLPTLQTKSNKYSQMPVVGEATVGKTLLVLKLSEMLKDSPITVNIFQPGYVPDSSYGADTGGLMQIFGKIMGRFSKIDASIGAELATAKDLASISGKFFNEKRAIVPLSSKYTLAMAQAWWELSEKL